LEQLGSARPGSKFLTDQHGSQPGVCQPLS